MKQGVVLKISSRYAICAACMCRPNSEIDLTEVCAKLYLGRCTAMKLCLCSCLCLVGLALLHCYRCATATVALSSNAAEIHMLNVAILYFVQQKSYVQIAEYAQSTM